MESINTKKIYDQKSTPLTDSDTKLPYYAAQLNEQGEMDFNDKTMQYMIDIGCEIRFRLRRGCKVSSEAVLYVNKPKVNNKTGDIEYTCTQPRMIMKEDMTHLDEVQTSYEGDTNLDSHFLQKVEPFDENAINLEYRVTFEHAGSYFVQIEYFDKQIKQRNYTKPIYINVQPVMVRGDEKVKCKQLSITTVLSRCLGPLENWEPIMKNLAELNYNAVHYTPIQKYGESYSHYSLADQTIIDDYYYKGTKTASTKEQRIKLLKEKIDNIRNEYGLLGIVDIVLNHTANNSEWLLEHPESAYNTDDCPHLTSAYVLDRALADFSNEFALRKNGIERECPSAPFINNDYDLRTVISAIQNRVINGQNLSEYYMIDIEKNLQDLRQYIKSVMKQQLIEKTKQIIDRKKLWSKDHYALFMEQFAINHGAQRIGVTVDLPITAVYFYLANNQNEDKTINELRCHMQRHNTDWAYKIQCFMKEALQCIEGNLKYFKLELKDNKVTLDNKLLRRYFTELNNPQCSKVAHNGWIMNADAMVDFAMPNGGWHYLRRTINIWGDSVKLRYGKCPQDSPFLWQHMSTYVSDMASIFDGFRLDNAHSTPIHVCQYLLQVARCKNPNLFVMAELFTSSSEVDALFVKKLNLNGLVRELQNTYDTKQLGDYFHFMTCKERPIGLIDIEQEDANGEKFITLRPSKPNDIIYDCTHDNPSPFQKFRTGRIALPHLVVAAMADQPIASTFGYDQLIPENLNVVKEFRLYAAVDQSDLFTFDESKPNFSVKKSVLSPEWTPEEKSPKPRDFEYEFIYYNQSAWKVQIAGQFNGWKPGHDMKKDGRDKWTQRLTLPIVESQDKYEYKFVVNEREWYFNSQLPQTRDSNGNINNFVQIPGVTPKTITPISNNKEWVFRDIKYARMRMNEIHDVCSKNEAEIFLHQQSPEVLVIIRQLPLDFDDSFDAYVSITRLCYFLEQPGDYNYKTSIELPGFVEEVVFAGYLEFRDDSYDRWKDDKFINGSHAMFRVFKDLNKFCRRETVSGEQKERLNFFMMPPGFSCIIKTRHPRFMKESIRALNKLNQSDLSLLATRFFQNTPLSLINHLLFRCDTEEKEISNNTRGPYGLQKYGQFVYAGLTSLMHIFKELKVSGDMGHELFDNMRQGNWYLDYAKDRMMYMKDDAKNIITYLEEYGLHAKQLYPALRPKYGCRILEKLYSSAVYHVTHGAMGESFLKDLSQLDQFISSLALGTSQMYGRIPSAQFYDHQDTLCAGLPHFSTGYMRCWGRDTFIALRGMFLATGLRKEAKDIIIQFARVSRHGLIPNLHDRGNNTRFNARDAVWFFLQAIKDYVTLADDQNQAAKEILSEEIELHFRDNDQTQHWTKVKKGEPMRKISLGTLMHEMLQAHAQGIEFREWNAGTQIDSCMQTEGFNVKIWLDKETGFLFGGNKYNCGTWMDKMGSSEKTGNKGIPATPRDGAPIELTAMLFSVLRFMDEMYQKGHIRSDRVQLMDSGSWTYSQWAQKIQANFEKHYYIPSDQKDDHNFMIEKKIVNRRGIYKDVIRPTHLFTEYQLRPNLLIAMSYAPELFDKAHAQTCLLVVENVLMERGCMGIKTLDPSDRNYKGDYINSDDSHGWNYHQGPEWVWPVGFFLKSKMLFCDYESKSQALDDLMSWLLPHQINMVKDPWEGLPELTNSHGKVCYDSCRTQAWSISTIMDAVRDMHYYLTE